MWNQNIHYCGTAVYTNLEICYSEIRALISVSDGVSFFYSKIPTALFDGRRMGRLFHMLTDRKKKPRLYKRNICCLLNLFFVSVLLQLDTPANSINFASHEKHELILQTKTLTAFEGAVPLLTLASRILQLYSWVMFSIHQPNNNSISDILPSFTWLFESTIFT